MEKSVTSLRDREVSVPTAVLGRGREFCLTCDFFREMRKNVGPIKQCRNAFALASQLQSGD
jgi:hypothetical protein